MQGLLTKFGKRGWNTLYSKTKLQFITGQSRRLHQSPEGSLEDLFTSLDWHRRRTSWIISIFSSKCAEWGITRSACSVAQSHCPSDASKMKATMTFEDSGLFYVNEWPVEANAGREKIQSIRCTFPSESPWLPAGRRRSICGETRGNMSYSRLRANKSGEPLGVQRHPVAQQIPQDHSAIVYSDKGILCLQN